MFKCGVWKKYKGKIAGLERTCKTRSAQVTGQIEPTKEGVRWQVELPIYKGIGHAPKVKIKTGVVPSVPEAKEKADRQMRLGMRHFYKARLRKEAVL